MVNKPLIKDFEFFEHTADVKFKAYGKSLEEAFCNAVKATFSVMTDISKLNGDVSKDISIKSSSREALLYDFLEEALFLFDTEGFLVMESKIKIVELDDSEGFLLNGRFKGCFVNNLEIHTYIKSVTYNDMLIFKEDDLFVVQVVHDI